MLDPLTNPIEHGFDSEEALLRRVRFDPILSAQIAKAFGLASPRDIELRHITLPLVQFITTLDPGESAFDRYTERNDATAMTIQAERGYKLFIGAAQCAACHTVEKHNASFTDHSFHSVGVGLARIQPRLPSLTRKVTAAHREGSRIDRLITTDADVAELGRFAVTLDPADIGKFRTPSLRNVALTAPYMHDGSMATLEEAVEHEVYYRGLQTGRPLALTPGDKSDLVEFLKALTGYVAATPTAPRQNAHRP